MSDRYNPFDDIDIEIRGRNVRDDDTTCLLSCGCLVGFVIGVLSGFFMYGFWSAVFHYINLI